MEPEIETVPAAAIANEQTPAANIEKSAVPAKDTTLEVDEATEIEKLPAWAQRHIKELRNEAAKTRKAKQAAEQAAQAEADQKLKDEKKWQDLADKREQELVKLKQQLHAKELDEQRRAIALKVGLPEQLAKRITGETPEEMEADAKVMLEALPQKPSAHQDASHGKGKGDASLLTDEEKQRLADQYGVKVEFIK